MKLPFIASLICLMASGCATSQPVAPLPPKVVTVRQLPLPIVKGEVVADSVVFEEVQETSPEDYQQLSSLIHRETRNIKCVCADGDPFCRCKLPNGPKKLPQE